MAAKDNMTQSVDTMLEGLGKFVSAKTVVGQEIRIDDTIIIPLVSVSFGMAAGAFGGDRKDNNAGGMGGRISPNSVIVIHNGITRLINISTHTGMDRILDMVPDFVDRFTTKQADKKEQKNRSAREAAAEDIRSKVAKAQGEA